MEHAVDRVQQAQRGQAGLLRIGYVVSASYEILPPILAEFCLRSPSVALRMLSRSTSELIDLLLDDDLSVGFVREFQQHLDLDSEQLYTEQLLAVLPAQHPAAKRAQRVSARSSASAG